MVEQRFRKPQVVGSIPTLGSKFAEGEFDPEAALSDATNRSIVAAEGPKDLKRHRRTYNVKISCGFKK